MTSSADTSIPPESTERSMFSSVPIPHQVYQMAISLWRWVIADLWDGDPTAMSRFGAPGRSFTKLQRYPAHHYSNVVRVIRNRFIFLRFFYSTLRWKLHPFDRFISEYHIKLKKQFLN